MKNGHRPMRRQKREVTSPEELRRILEKCQILRIGAMDEEGMFVVPVNYGFEWEDELLLYFHSAKEGRKADAFRKDPNVAFELDCGYEVITGDYACSYSAAYESIMGNGTVTLLETPEKRTGADPSYEACGSRSKPCFPAGNAGSCRCLLPPGIVSYR